jgi:hypothetical protein
MRSIGDAEILAHLAGFDDTTMGKDKPLKKIIWRLHIAYQGVFRYTTINVHIQEFPGNCPGTDLSPRVPFKRVNVYNPHHDTDSTDGYDHLQKGLN